MSIQLRKARSTGFGGTPDQPPASGEVAHSTGLAGNMSSIATAMLKDVSVRFGGTGGQRAKTILSNVSIEVGQREFLVLVGRSGCGKTTVLNLVAGLLEPSSGSVEVLGGTPSESIGRVGYMFARDALMPWRTAIRNVEVVLELRGMPRDERREAALHYLDMVGLGNEVKAYPGRLSQGMRQRVALARTWAFDPTLLLMDEPFAALDAQTRLELQAQFVRMWEQQRKTVIFVTHDLTEAITLADRVVVLGSGRVIDEFVVPFPRPRDPLEVTTSEEFQSLHRRLWKEIE